MFLNWWSSKPKSTPTVRSYPDVAQEDIAGGPRAFSEHSRPNHDNALTTTAMLDPTNGNGVTYASRDRGRKVEFVAHLPPGSKLAAEAQQLALEVYTGCEGYAKSGRRLRHNENRLITDSDHHGRRDTLRTVSRVQEGNNAPQDSECRQSRRSDTGPKRQFPEPQVSNIAPETRATTRVYHRAPPPPTARPLTDSDAAPRAALTHQAHPEFRSSPQPRSSFKHTSDTHETYIMRGQNEMYVSAPTGSKEAEVHRGVAAMIARTGPGGIGGAGPESRRIAVQQ